MRFAYVILVESVSSKLSHHIMDFIHARLLSLYFHSTLWRHTRMVWSLWLVDGYFLTMWFSELPDTSSRAQNVIGLPGGLWCGYSINNYCKLWFPIWLHVRIILVHVVARQYCLGFHHVVSKSVACWGLWSWPTVVLSIHQAILVPKEKYCKWHCISHRRLARSCRRNEQGNEETATRSHPLPSQILWQ